MQQNIVQRDPLDMPMSEFMDEVIRPFISLSEADKKKVLDAMRSAAREADAKLLWWPAA